MSAPGTNKVEVEVRPDGVAVVTIDHFPLNTLSNAIMLGIEVFLMADYQRLIVTITLSLVEDAAEQIAKDASIKGVVVRGAGTRKCAFEPIHNHTPIRSPKANICTRQRPHSEYRSNI